ncbi:unnamed protein product, partial [Choristocarpus tenellus]
YHIRACKGSDYTPVIGKLNEWWGGREINMMLPRLFFDHFQSTSFVAVATGSMEQRSLEELEPTKLETTEVDDQIWAFLCGFLSPTKVGQAYVHFVGVDPTHRGKGIGRRLYEEFFLAATRRGCNHVRCVTSPVNVSSQRFHMRLGFVPVPASPVSSISNTREGGDKPIVHVDYDGPGEHRIILEKTLM